MHGGISPTLEAMRIKASYVENFDGAAVLDTIVEPSLEDPFQTLTLKWMEVDIPFAFTSLVKNRDYVYLEGTGHVHGLNGERLGYHVMHSVNFPQTHDLANRIRGNISALAFWQQTGPNTLDMWGIVVMDPGGDMIRMIIVPAMVGAFMSSVKYGYCGQMKKLAWMLERRYEESKQHGAPKLGVPTRRAFASHALHRLQVDVSETLVRATVRANYLSVLCATPASSFGKLSLVDPDLLLSQRKVTFCTGCISEVTCLSSTDAARAMMLGKKCLTNLSATDSTTAGISSISM